MKAAVYNKYGPPEVVQVKDIPKPTPKDNEVLIRNHATTVTRGDSRIRSFVVPSALEWLLGKLFLGVFSPRRKVLGMELAGEIEAIGKNVTSFKVGDQVFASTYTGYRFGAHAEYVCLAENGVIAIKPTNMTYEEAAPLPSGGAAALVYIRTMGKVKEGEKVLINSAFGTLGTYGVQIAKSLGAEVTGVCSTRNIEMVKSIGADHVIDYTKEDFTQGDVKYDLVFDGIRSSSAEKCRNVLTPNGRYIRTDGPEPTREDLLFLKDIIEGGKLRTVIDKRFTLDQIVEAHRYVDSGSKKGNVIIRFD